jgi:homeobox protein cut-like
MLITFSGIDLTSLLPTLDSTAAEIVANQRDALVERKELAQKTKDFRKLDDAGKLLEHKALLKSYQIFIDLLTNHGKTTSTAFLQVFSSLSDAPDPFPLLEASVEAVMSAEDIAKLTTENEGLQASVKRLTAQLDETERKLESERSAKREIEDTSDKRMQDVEATWKRVMEEDRDNFETKEKALDEKVENQDRLLKELKASYEVLQRLGPDDDSTANAAQQKAYSAELEMMSSELERSGSRLAEMEARNEQLRVELAGLASRGHSSQRSIEDDPGYLRLQSENSSLLRKIEASRIDRDSEKREWHNKLRLLEQERKQLVISNDAFQTKVQKWADHDEIKRELDMLKSIELGEEQDVNETSQEMNGSAGGKESLEKVLLQRNKKLSNDLTIMRVSHQELQQQLELLQEELSKAHAELERSQALSESLENDLLKVQEEAGNIFQSSAMSVAGTYSSRFPRSGRGRSSPTSSIISGYESRTPTSTLDSLRAGDPIGGGSGMMPLIQAQRDRFKKKNAELEEEISKTYATVTALRQEVASLQKDNLSLYEKTRYVSTYNRGQSGTSASSSAYGSGPKHTAISMPDDKYRSQYEANISPFAAFRGRESQRAYKRMSLPERMIFSITRIVMATRTSRNLFAGYCITLHVFLLFMLYHLGTSDVDHAACVGESAVAAMVAAKAGGSSHDDWQQEGFG